MRRHQLGERSRARPASSFIGSDGSRDGADHASPVPIEFRRQPIARPEGRSYNSRVRNTRRSTPFTSNTTPGSRTKADDAAGQFETLVRHRRAPPHRRRPLPASPPRCPGSRFASSHPPTDRASTFAFAACNSRTMSTTPRVAQVRAILLERQPQTRIASPTTWMRLRAIGRITRSARRVGPMRLLMRRAARIRSGGSQHRRLVRQVVRIHADAVAADQAGLEWQEVPLRPAAASTSWCRCPSPRRSSPGSLIGAMLTSRWVFSMTFAASATLMLGAWWVPASMMRRTARPRNPRPRRRTGRDLADAGREPALLVARVDPFRAVAAAKSTLKRRPDSRSSTGADLSVVPGYTMLFVHHDIAALSARPMLALADCGPKSGRFASSTGVGTVTTKTLQPVNAAGSAVSRNRVAAASASSPVFAGMVASRAEFGRCAGIDVESRACRIAPNSTASGRSRRSRADDGDTGRNRCRAAWRSCVPRDGGGVG